MSVSVEALAAQASSLSLEDRTHLADILLASLSEGDDAEIDSAWDTEIQTRVNAVKSGTARMASSEDVHAQARKIYQR